MSREDPGKTVGGAPRASNSWFEEAFDDFYPRLYAHRSDEEAAALVALLRVRHGLGGGVLDVACGAGRFLAALEDEGTIAHGVDLSAPLLRLARKRPGGKELRLVRADMRRLPIRRGSVDWVLLLFTSFGYFDEIAEDVEVLKEASRVLRPGGGFVLDYLNPVTAVRDLVPESRRKLDRREVRETRWVDERGPFLRKRVHLGPGPGDPARVYEERVRLYSRGELDVMLRSRDLILQEVIGDYAGGEFQPDRSPRCLMVCRKGKTL